jgi:putative membrane protein insertion efficiency factor
MKWLMRLLIEGYRNIISPYLPPSCRFNPTCSAYALQVLEKHNLTKSLWLILRRILSCHPFNKGGNDPVS